MTTDGTQIREDLRKIQTAMGVDMAEPCPTVPRVSLTSDPQAAKWFAVYTRTRFEKKTFSELQEKGIEAFLPLFTKRNRWSDRYQAVQIALFPCYVFVRLAPLPEARISVLRTRGVRNFVGAHGVGTVIPDSEIQAIERLLAQKVPFQLHPFLDVGQRVRIRGGCLDGIEGILTGIHGNENLVVSVQLIQKSVVMKISGYEVEPIQSSEISQRQQRVGAKEALSLGPESEGFRRSGHGSAFFSHS